MSSIILTGARGHAGAALVDKILECTECDVISIQRLPKVGQPNRLEHLYLNPRFKILYHDFRSPVPHYGLTNVEYIIHNGAEVHAIRSITDPELFWKTNVLGTFNLLELARAIKPKLFLYTSSAEVVANRPGGALETDPLDPPNPYAASKAAGEMLVNSYVKSFGVPAITTRTMNLFGEKQQNSKFIPVIIGKILKNEVIDVHTDADGQPGRRQWLHVDSYAQALLDTLTFGRVGQTYHIAGYTRSNLELVQDVSMLTGKTYRAVAAKHQYPNSVPIHHALNCDKFYNEIGANRAKGYIDYMAQTVGWYRANQEWL